jgi:acylphosphatase
MSAKASARIVVTGEVQGVAFRYHTLEEARRLGVQGWVRNTPDGRVEIEAEGERSGVEALVEWCHRGPPAARVDDVRVSFGPFSGTLGAFSIRH